MLWLIYSKNHLHSLKYLPTNIKLLLNKLQREKESKTLKSNFIFFQIKTWKLYNKSNRCWTMDEGQSSWFHTLVTNKTFLVEQCKRLSLVILYLTPPPTTATDFMESETSNSNFLLDEISHSHRIMVAPNI